MKRRDGLIFLAVLCVGLLSLEGCSSRGSSPDVPAYPDSSLSQGSRTTDASIATGGTTTTGATIDEAALTAGDQPIIDAAAPHVGGTYAGTIQDRTPAYGYVDRGTIRFILHHSGSAVSGTIHIVNSEGGTAAYTFTGTAAATAKGAILQLSIADSSGRTVGVWAKVIGTTLFGKGWALPDATTDQSYEQLLFTMHKT